MIVIKMVGGLGNQMFQYALYRKFLELKKDVRYDSIQTKEHNGFELEKVFNVVKNPIQSLEADSKIFDSNFYSNQLVLG